MRDHSVSIDRSVKPARIDYAPVFNVAVPFIDRHLAEGRGEKIAIRAAAGDVSYAALAQNVNRCGNVFRGLGLGPGDRVLMIVKDCAEFFYAFWGAIKAGYVPAPLNTMLRAHDYVHMIESSGAAALVYSPEFAVEVEGALARAGVRPAHVLRADGEKDSLAGRIVQASAALDPAPATAGDDRRRPAATDRRRPASSEVVSPREANRPRERRRYHQDHRVWHRRARHQARHPGVSASGLRIADSRGERDGTD